MGSTNFPAAWDGDARYRQRNDRAEQVVRGCGKCSRRGTGRRGVCLCVWLAFGCGGIQLAFQRFDLAQDGFEFGFLALEEGLGDAGFFFHPGALRYAQLRCSISLIILSVVAISAGTKA